MHLGGTAVKTIAQQAHVELFQPECVNSSFSLRRLSAYSADLFVVVAYGQLFSDKLLKVPGICAVNLHASLLPKYRGAAPVNWALIRGEEVTGTTVMRMESKMDAGPLIIQKPAPILPFDNALTLTEKLAGEGAQLLGAALTKIARKDFTLTPQDESQATFAPRLKKTDGLIDWSAPATEIHNLVRGCLSWPGAYTFYRGRMLKVYKTRPLQQLPGEQPRYGDGEVVEVRKDAIVVSCAASLLSIEELQPEGKRRMSCSEFISGHRIGAGERFSNK